MPAEAVLTVAGNHVPMMPFVEVRGKTGGALFRHSGFIAAKSGVTGASVVITIVVVVAHKPAVGVKV